MTKIISHSKNAAARSGILCRAGVGVDELTSINVARGRVCRLGQRLMSVEQNFPKSKRCCLAVGSMDRVMTFGIDDQVLSRPPSSERLTPGAGRLHEMCGGERNRERADSPAAPGAWDHALYPVLPTVGTGARFGNITADLPGSTGQACSRCSPHDAAAVVIFAASQRSFIDVRRRRLGHAVRTWR